MQHEQDMCSEMATCWFSVLSNVLVYWIGFIPFYLWFVNRGHKRDESKHEYLILSLKWEQEKFW